MQLLQELLTILEAKIQNTHVFDDRDLVMIMNSLYKVEKVPTKVNCLVKAVVEAIYILTGERLSTKDFDTKAKGGALKGSDAYEKIHPNTLKNVAKGGVKKGDDDLDPNATEIKYDLELGYVHNSEDIKEIVRSGIPVVLSIVWTDLIFYPVVWITRPKQKERIQTYKDMGADQEMLDKVMNHHIVPYPNDELIKKSKEIADPHSNVKHAVLVVGYDAGQKVFICRDFSIHNGEEMGFFKVDERIFFDEKLKAQGLATVEAGLVVQVHDVEDDKQLTAQPIAA